MQGGIIIEEGKTSVNKCFGTCQPYGMGGNIKFWTKVLGAPPEEQKRMISGVDYWRLYQSILVGNQYYCFKCEETCPDNGVKCNSQPSTGYNQRQNV